MKLSSKKLLTEDFKSQVSWIGPLLSALNDFIQQVTSGFNNNLTIEDNFMQELKDVNFLNDTGIFPISIKLKFNQMPKAVYIAYCRSTTDNSMPSVQPLLDWEYANQTIKLNSISGLTSSKKYLVRLHIIYS